jgi:hypothetical protein
MIKYYNILHKSSTEKNDVNGTTIDMLIDDRML